MSNLRRCLERFAREESGAYAVEFALISTAFFMLMFGCAYLGIMMFYRSSIQYAVENSVRMVSVDKNTTQSQITTAINNYLESTGLPDASVSYASSVYNGVQVGTVTASFTKSITMPFVSTFNLTYSATAKMPKGN